MKDSCDIFRGRYPRTALNGTTPPSSLEDMSRGKNNGVFSADAPVWKQEKSGIWVIEHDNGLNQYATLGTKPTMSMGLGDQSVALWLKMAETGYVGARYFVRCGGNGVRAGYRIFSLSSNTKIYISFSSGLASELQRSYTVANIYDSRYHFFVCTMQRTSNVLMYLDAVLSVETLNISGENAFITNDENFVLGFSATGMYGRMGGVRVTNRIYTPDEILRMYIAEAPLYGLKV